MNYVEKAAKRLVESYKELPEKYQQFVIDQIQYDGMLQAAEEVKKTGTVLLGDLYAQVLDRQPFFNSFEGTSTGLKYFDDAAMGLRPGELIVIAGPSNYGKTMIALNVALGTAITAQKRILIISMEMTALEIASRLYNMTTDHDALETMAENIIIQTELQVSSKHIAAMIERHKPDMVLIDHLQFLAKQENGSEYERVTAATANAKRLALEYKLPLLLVSHVSKARSGREGQATAADLKSSSSIEQDCDVGFMINRRADAENSDEIVLTLFKHRTKRPFMFHKDAYLRLEGVRVADGGRYSLKPLLNIPDFPVESSGPKEQPKEPLPLPF